MKIMILTQYFTPEIGATQTRLHTFAEGLAARGHEVRVICEVPNHPQGIVRDGYRRRAVVRRRIDGFTADYVWVHATPVKTARTRMAFYASYTMMAMLAGTLARGADVVVASSPPLPVAVAGAALARRHRAPWVMDVRDLWPDAALAMGELSEGRAFRAAQRLERFLYEDAAAITAVTEPFVEQITSRVTRGEKVSLLPNGTTEFWLSEPDQNGTRGELGLSEDKFVWTFAGNLGRAQGLEALVSTAALLDDGFQLLILGDGPDRSRLEETARRIPPGQILFRDQVRREVAKAYLRASDALVVSLAPDPILQAFVPSKLFDYCAIGRPVVVAAGGEPHRLVQAANAAVPVAPGDPTALADALRWLAAEPREAERLAQRGRAFARAHLRERQVDALDDLLRKTIRTSSRS